MKRPRLLEAVQPRQLQQQPPVMLVCLLCVVMWGVRLACV